MLPLDFRLRSAALFQVSVSFFGLILVALFAISPPVAEEAFAWRKPLVGSAFAAVCVLGISAVLFPKACSRFFSVNRKEKEPNPQFSHAASSGLRGHHPQCGHFLGHVITIGGRVLCAACSGLFLGALFALVGVGAGFFGNWQIGQNALAAVAVGAVGVALGLLQPLLPMLQSGAIRLFTGAFLAVGTSLILFGIEDLTRNVSLDLFVVALSILWLVTRISLSQWNHERICSRCTSDSCDFKRNLGRKDD